MSEWTNWSGLASARPDRVVTPEDVAGVAAAVKDAAARGGTVKMVGTGHSFTPIAVAEDVLLRPDALRGITAVDRDAMTVTALAGTPLHVLNAELERLGLSLHNMGDIDEQTLAGATSTGTHGTGGVAASLSAQIVGLELVDRRRLPAAREPGRERRRLRRRPDRPRRAGRPHRAHLRRRAARRARGARAADGVGGRDRGVRRPARRRTTTSTCTGSRTPTPCW